MASAVLMATERMRTMRRNEAKTTQEGAVAEALIAAGFTRVERPRAIRTLEDAPAPGEFCDEVDFGGRKADLVVGLWDRRRMPLECKVSNSMTNSFKRVNNDAAVKAVGLAARLRRGPGGPRRGPLGRLQGPEPRTRPRRGA